MTFISFQEGDPDCIGHNKLFSNALSKTIHNLNLNRFILVGDRGMYRGDNTFYLTNMNNGYIISKSIEKTATSEKEWIYNQEGYISISSDFKYKSRIIKRKVTVGDEKKDITEKVVVYFSQKFYDKQINENKSFLDFIDKLQENPKNFRITKSQSNSLKKFLRKDVINEKTGEIIEFKIGIKMIQNYYCNT